MLPDRLKKKTFRKIMIGYSMFEMLFCSSPIFGWASLAYILKKENYFAQSCAMPSGQNSTGIISKNTICREQEDQLNIAYTVGSTTAGLVAFPIGYLLDTFGPKVTRYASSALFGISAIFWMNFTKESQYFIYPALLTFSSAGVFSSFAFFQVSAFYCRNNQSTVLGLQNGAYNASAVILQVIKLLYELQKVFRLEILLALYCGLASILVLGTTFIFIPAKNDLVKHVTSRNVAKEELLKEKVELTSQNGQIPKGSGDCEAGDCCCEEDFLPVGQGITARDSLISIQNENTTMMKRGSMPNVMLLDMTTQKERSSSTSSLDDIVAIDETKLTAFNALCEGSRLSINCAMDVQNNKNFDKAIIDKRQKQHSSLRAMLCSGIFLWHQFFSSVFYLRISFFITTFESLLLSIKGSNQATVNRYVNILGTTQLVGVIFAPMLGPYIDKRAKNQKVSSFQEYRALKMKRCAIALAITNTMNVIMGAAVLIPILEVQAIAIGAQVILRGFFFAFHFSYFAVIFPPEHYGKLTCLSLLIGVSVGSLQYPLRLLSERTFGNNPFWVNVGLLVFSVIAYGQTIHLIRYSKKCST